MEGQKERVLLTRHAQRNRKYKQGVLEANQNRVIYILNGVDIPAHKR